MGPAGGFPNSSDGALIITVDSSYPIVTLLGVLRLGDESYFPGCDQTPDVESEQMFEKEGAKVWHPTEISTCEKSMFYRPTHLY